MQVVSSVLLSLVIPTYNRADFVYDQLCWIFREAEGHWQNLELIVLDNHSSDETSRIKERFIGEQRERIQLVVNDVNIGLVRNCIKGLQVSKGKFVWLIGDDDPLMPGLLKKIVEVLGKHTDTLKLLHINHDCTDGYQGNVLIPSFYDVQEDVYLPAKGYQLVNRILAGRHTGGFMFITANVLNRTAALQIVEETPEPFRSQLAFPMYFNAKLACNGGFYYMSGVDVTCVYNQSSWLSQFDEVHHVQLPFFWFRLRKEGLDKKLITTMIRTAEVPETRFRASHFVKDIFKEGWVKAKQKHRTALAMLKYKTYFLVWKLTGQR